MPDQCYNDIVLTVTPTQRAAVLGQIPDCQHTRAAAIISPNRKDKSYETPLHKITHRPHIQQGMERRIWSAALFPRLPL